MKVSNNMLDRSTINNPSVNDQRNVNVVKYVRQIAHDIRGPLTALDSLVHYCKDKLGNEETKIMLTILDRLHGIADNLLKKPSDINIDANTIPTKIPDREFITLVKNIIEEKKIQCREKYNVKINDVLIGTPIKYSSSYDVQINPVEFQRILSNISNNAIEAVGNRGNILFVLKREKNKIIIAVDDDGKGINLEVLPHLMQEGATFGKEGGNGLGLSHAKKTLNLWGGEISIESKKGAGTIVKMTLPIEINDKTQGSSSTAIL
ncbi:MAG: HAMP domain-containing sensor histidine kinase [bacterium]